MKNKAKLIEKLAKNIEDGIHFFNRKDVKKAKELFYKVLDDDPTNPEANYYLGLMFSKDENWKKAVLHLKAVVDLGVNFLYTQQCRMILGYIYSKNKEYTRAEYEFLEVLKAKFNIVQVYAALAAIKHYLGEKEEAIMYAEKACDVDSFNLNAKNTYGYFLCEYGIDVPKGLEMLREVVRIKPNNPAYLDSLGWAYHKKGDKKAAILSLQKAIELSKNSSEIKDHLDEVTYNY